MENVKFDDNSQYTELWYLRGYDNYDLNHELFWQKTTEEKIKDAILPPQKDIAKLKKQIKKLKHG